MDKITWDKSWCLDNGVIDKQHKYLITILNRIIGREIDIYVLIVSLIEYSSNHFVDEEVLMIKNNYPEDKYLLHKKEHRLFTKALLEISFGLLTIIDSKKLEIIIGRVENFCFVWFNKHFLNTDKEFVIFLNKGGALADIVCN
jgi:hemerythrin-like metal-binding protein